ncbi:hypothetical protein K437DRAFT_239118 [Tilletiaria anomala UBC 951]|uniref:PEBP-like protein n=1 Tax=Tilletiaria anomala (strain ATCC 24038 / CBS 436.72 / UBC 951) TaxID=1037660 RepID=A0A066VE55_TILAU|nr:uncharacterized protein K437DRAFT_239118 [Tilletiaria anomala UBC 951]KDN40027.1 hypothetical protein K437DRAFT_239118 [Tilletiaria anomala UBC 951]
MRTTFVSLTALALSSLVAAAASGGGLANVEAHKRRIESRAAAKQASASSSAPADVAASIAQAVTQFQAAQLVPKPIQQAWLNPLAALTISYDGKPAVLGSKQAVADLQSRPIYSLNYTSSASADAAAFTNSAKFTVMFIDASFVGDNSIGNNVTRHYLGNDYTIDTQTGALQGGTPITKYAAPLPKSGDPPHRYMQLVWAQPASFKAPALPAEGSGVESWDVSSYVTQAGLQHIVALSYIQVQVGTSSQVAATSAPAAASVASASASALAALSGSSTTAPSATSTGANGSKNAAVSTLPAASLALVLAGFGAAGVLAL